MGKKNTAAPSMSLESVVPYSRPYCIPQDVRESMRTPISLAHKMTHSVWPSKRGPSKDELRHDRDDELVSLLLEVNLYPQKKT